MKRMALFIAPLALCGAMGCNDRDNETDGVIDAPSSPIRALPGYKTPWDSLDVTPLPSTTTTPGRGEGEREQGGATGTLDSTSGDAMGSGAPAVPSAPGSMDAGATSATGQTPPASAGTTDDAAETTDDADEDLNDNGIDDDVENEQSDAAP